jgi:ketol-acid reductoisomerase
VPIGELDHRLNSIVFRRSLFPLIGKYGMDYMYNACSTTARRGALDWAPKFYEANLPVFKSLYENVKNGNETRRSLQFNGQKDYREKFAEETAEIDAQEIWRAGKTGKSKKMAIRYIMFSPD